MISLFRPVGSGFGGGRGCAEELWTETNIGYFTDYTDISGGGQGGGLGNSNGGGCGYSPEYAQWTRFGDGCGCLRPLGILLTRKQQ